jgi:hypothetical protein
MFAPRAHPSVEFDGVSLDPGAQIRPTLLASALTAWRAHPQARRDRLAIVDFAKPSTAARFYLVDLRTGAVEALRTAHGKGSDPARDGVARWFSDVANSNASSLGAYLTAAPYQGKHGLSLTLDGLDPSNMNARARAIVVHSASYMTSAFIAQFGQPGRSWGCFVVEPAAIAHVVNWLKGGVLLYAGR